MLSCRGACNYVALTREVVESCLLFRGFLRPDDTPTKVLEVRSKDYMSRPVHYREDAVILYGPNTSSRNAKEKCFEIVYQRPFTESLHQMYSLFRSQDQSEAETRFISYKDIIPVFIKLSKECSVPNIQKICDTIGEHTSWTIAHHVANFGLNEMFNEPDVQKHIHDIDCSTGRTPLMVAIETGNFRTVQSLVSLKSPLDKADFNGNNVYHYAALSTKDIITLLATNSTQCLNTYNKSGYTPLHVACSENKPECVRALIVAGANVNLPASASNTISPSTPGFVGDVLQDNLNKIYTQDMKFGGTPLHWALSKEVVEVLVDKNCNINSLNFEGRTALHIMALRERLECVVALLSRGAEVSIGDKKGDTPLHLAVKQSNIAIVQALVVFGADLNYQNNAGATPRHMLPADMASSKADKILYIIHAVGAQRCTPEMVGCAPSCAALGDYNGVPPPPVACQAPRHALNQMLAVAGMERASCLAKDHKMGRLLCLDGGGIRGLVLIQLLLEMESVMGKPLVHCFDWISGTSTGGILALALATGKTLKECQCLYFRMKEYAFAGKKPYPSEALESILKDCLGTETKMSDIKHPKLMITGILADRKPVDLHIFRNYESAQNILDAHNGTCSPTAEATCSSNVVMSLPAPPPPSSQLVWEAARATGAAPSYFRAFGRYLDGGLVANNPTLDALTELAELRLALRATGREDEARKTQLKVIVSCGTGLVPVVKLTDIDIFRPENLWDAARVAFGVSAIGDLLVDQATLSDGRVVDRARAWCSSMGVPYHRFNPQLARAVAMDERLDDRLVCMLWEAKAYMCANIDRVREVCVLLDDN